MNRMSLVLGGVIAALVVAIAGVYFFGTPTSGTFSAKDAVVQPPAAAVVDASTESAPAGDSTMGDVPITSDKAPAPDPRVPLAIEIPGCTCHSDDPKVVKEHEKYRMNQCAGCHGGKTPTGR